MARNTGFILHASRRRTIQGALLGLGAPLGWVVVERLLGMDRLVPSSYELALLAYMAFGTMLMFALFGFVLGRAEEGFARMSMLDDLTGLYNSRLFHSVLEREVSNAARYNTPLGLAIVDLDRFKNVNDSYGHKVGDAVLRAVGQTIQQQVRDGDIVARIGGEEFAVIMPQTGCSGGRIMGERVRKAIAETDVPLDEARTIRINGSVGLACTDVVHVGESKDLFVLADRALYHAKQTGRNRVVLVSDIPGFDSDAASKQACSRQD